MRINAHRISTNYGLSYGGHDDVSLHNSYGNIHQDISSYGSYDSSYGGGGHGFNSGLDHGLYEGHAQHHYGVQTVPISEHVEITKPVPVPVVKNIGKFVYFLTTFFASFYSPIDQIAMYLCKFSNKKIYK